MIIKDEIDRKAAYWDRLMKAWRTGGTEDEFSDEFMEQVVELINDYEAGK